MSAITLSEGVLAVCRDQAVIIKNISGNKVTVRMAGGEKIVKPKDLLPIHPGPAAGLPEICKNALSSEEAAELIGSEELAFDEFTALLFEKYTPETAWSAYIEVANGVWFSFTSSMNVICKDEQERLRLISEREAKAAE